MCHVKIKYNCYVQVVDQINAWNDGGRKGQLRTAKPNWRQMSTKLASNKEFVYYCYFRI